MTEILTFNVTDSSRNVVPKQVLTVVIQPDDNQPPVVEVKSGMEVGYGRERGMWSWIEKLPLTKFSQLLYNQMTINLQWSGQVRDGGRLWEGVGNVELNRNVAPNQVLTIVIQPDDNQPPVVKVKSVMEVGYGRLWGMWSWIEMLLLTMFAQLLYNQMMINLQWSKSSQGWR